MDTDVHSPEIDEFLAWMAFEKGRAAATVEAYGRDLRALASWLDEHGASIATASHDLLLDWVNEQLVSDRARSTTKRAVTSVRNLYRFCLAEGLLSVDPAAELGVPKVPSGVPKALKESEIGELLDAVDGGGPSARRDRSMLELLYGSGMRISEMVGLSLPDLDLDARLVRVFGKGSKERIIPIGAIAFEALVAYLSLEGRGLLEPESWASREDSEAVYLNRRGGRMSRQGAWGIVKKYGAKVGLGAKLSPHVLRHSCATHMLDHGADVRTVQELLGHASVTTTQIYTKVSRERLFEVHRNAHPRANG